MSWRIPAVSIYQDRPMHILAQPVMKYLADRHAHFIADTHKNGHPDPEKIASFIADLQRGFQQHLQLVKDQTLVKQIEHTVKTCLGDLKWDYNTNKPDTSCGPPALPVVVGSLSRMAYNLLGKADWRPDERRSALCDSVQSIAAPVDGPLLQADNRTGVVQKRKRKITLITSGLDKAIPHPATQAPKLTKTKEKPKNKRINTPDIKQQLEMVEVFQKTSKYRNEPHRCANVDIEQQLEMVNVFQKTSKYRNEPHRSNMINAIIAVKRGEDSARQAGRKYKVSARSIGRYIAALKKLQIKHGGAELALLPTQQRLVSSKAQPKIVVPPIQKIHTASDIHAAEELLGLLASGVPATANQIPVTTTTTHKETTQRVKVRKQTTVRLHSVSRVE